MFQPVVEGESAVDELLARVHTRKRAKPFVTRAMVSPYPKALPLLNLVEEFTEGQITAIIFGMTIMNTMSEATEATIVLQGPATGEPQAAEQLLVLIYDELRRLAASKLDQEAPGQTLQPTALVHEAWLRLVGDQNPSFKDRKHFFCAAAEAMRHILIDRARRKQTRRHGGDYRRVDFEELELAAPSVDEKLMAKRRYTGDSFRQPACQLEGVQADLNRFIRSDFTKLRFCRDRGLVVLFSSREYQ